MRWAFRIVSGLFVVTSAYVWTVGQTGLDATNKNLCELWAKVSHQTLSSCELHEWVLTIWIGGFFAAVGFLIFDLIRWLRSRAQKAQPKTDVVYQSSIAECKRIVTFTDGRKGVSFRVQVSSTIRLSSRGVLVNVKNLTTQQSVESVQLSWATLGMEGKSFTDLLPNYPQYLNVCEINDRNILSVRSTEWPVEAMNLFS
jgi:hypothetical protein